MLFKKDRKIRNLQAMVSNRDKLIKDMEEQALVLYNEKQQIKNENEDLRYELKKAMTLCNKVIKIVNNSGTIVDKYDKIKELVNNLQSVD